MKTATLKRLINKHLKEQNYRKKVLVEFPEEGKNLFMSSLEIRVLMYEVTRRYYQEGKYAAMKFIESFIVHDGDSVDSPSMSWRDLDDAPGKFNNLFRSGFLDIEDLFVLGQMDLVDENLNL